MPTLKKKTSVVQLRRVHAMLEAASALGCEVLMSASDLYMRGSIQLDRPTDRPYTGMGGFSIDLTTEVEIHTWGIAIDIARTANVPQLFATTYAPNDETTRKLDLERCAAELKRREESARRWMPSMPAPDIQAPYVTCSCCGTGIRDNPEENVEHGTGANDEGFGLCVKCGGDKTSTGDDEAAVRKRIGWAGEAFFDARIAKLMESLSPENVEKFSRMTYAKKVSVVTKLVEKGAML